MMLRSLLALVTGVGMVAVGVVPLVLWMRRRDVASRWIPALGALAWLLSVAAKVAWAVPTNPVVNAALVRALGPKGLFVMEGYIGLLTGIFEVGLVALAARFVARLRRASLDDAVAFGLAFGGAEALVMGIASLALNRSIAPHLVLVGPVERATALVVHVITCVLVLRGGRRAGALAFVYKSAVDMFAAWAILSWGVKTNEAHLLVFEAMLAALVAATAAAFFARRDRWIDVHG